MSWGRRYYALQAVGGAAWWIAVATLPWIRTTTLGSLDPVLVAVFDVPLFVVASALAAAGVRAAAVVTTVWTALVLVALSVWATVTGEAGWGVLVMLAATIGSVLGTLVGILLLAVITPPLGEFALSFGAFEFFWLALAGVMLSGNLAGTDPVKGWIAGILGLLVAMIGQEPAYGYPRFAFGVPELTGGIQLLPAMVGAFGFAEVLYVLRSKANASITDASDRIIPRMRDIVALRWTAVRSGVLGTFIGLLPGVGEDIGAWASYAVAKRFSKTPEKFGRGSTEGLMAAETGNNAAVPGALIPVLTLGIPGSGVAAVLMAALIIHGAQPGPLMMTTNPQMIYDIIAMLTVATLGILVFGLSLTRLMILVLKVKDTWLMPVVAVLCLVGPYAIQSSYFDIWVVVFFGVVGFGLRLMNYPMAPLVLGIVLGTILDSNLRRSVTLANGDFSAFFTRPISAFLCAIVVAMILAQVGPVRRLVGRGWSAIRGERP